MAPMPSTELSLDDKKALMAIARQSINHGLATHTLLSVNPADYSDNLQQQRATFVTLTIQQQLRGCIGTLDAYQSLLEDVTEHAYAAAFKDPRFPPVTPAEFEQLEIHISILTPSAPVHFTSEQDLIQQLRPGIDGLILEYKLNRGTFLPSVWDSLPDANDFLKHLKRKAGLDQNFWDDAITISRYETQSISEQDIMN
ncbi:MAG: AmmeMemoRadiSam system protein A [Gammaproteobacteria bacterium]|nr:AmmeMemoRadiSam system protein A [Gammaproteobacteria bacterium]